jgi:orotidine-5'-phosphate decarboxylase
MNENGDNPHYDHNDAHRAYDSRSVENNDSLCGVCHRLPPWERSTYVTTMTEPKDKIIVALDVDTACEAAGVVHELPDCSLFKIGPHFHYDRDARLLLDEDLTAGFPDSRANPNFFIDLKFFDIEATVAAAVANLATRSNDHTGDRQFVLATVHAHVPVMKAAVKAAKDSQLKILAVPLMTSFSRGDLKTFYGYDGDVIEFVVERTRRAVDAGCAGVICSANEVAMLRGNVVPADFLLVVPGTRSDKIALHDHKRTGSPAQAIRDGANYLVVGRQILQAESRLDMFAQIVDEISSL